MRFGKGKEVSAYADRESPKTWKRSQLTPNTSCLMIGDKEKLPLEGILATVCVDGFRARVLLDCYFYVPNNCELMVAIPLMWVNLIRTALSTWHNRINIMGLTLSQR